MKAYQLTYLIPSDLNEEEIKNISERINSSIKDNGGTLDNIKNPTKKILGHSIKNKKEAYLLNLDFHIEPEKLKEIESQLRQTLSVLRYIIVFKKPTRLVKKPRIPMLHQEIKILKKAERPKEKKVELKEIEKKLEEILEK